MSLLRVAKILVLASAASMLTGCGFQPIYATPEGRSAALNQQIAIGAIEAPESVKSMVTDALSSRIFVEEGQTPQYDLNVLVQERAERLAVQIDATVTRYNYRLRAEYFLVDTNTGTRLSGRVEAVTSYNIVTSIYSTLFAERTAQEKASRLLAEEIERDILLRYSGVYSTPATEGEESPEDGAEETNAETFHFLAPDDLRLDRDRSEGAEDFFSSEGAAPDPVVDDPAVDGPVVSDPIVDGSAVSDPNIDQTPDSDSD